MPVSSAPLDHPAPFLVLKLSKVEGRGVCLESEDEGLGRAEMGLIPKPVFSHSHNSPCEGVSWGAFAVDLWHARCFAGPGREHKAEVHG